MADLSVDSGLDNVNAGLKQIADEFSNAQDNADVGDDVWGQPAVAKAMHDFAHDWWVHREKISDRLTKLSTRVGQAVQTWGDADQQLASSLATQTDEGTAAAAAAAAAASQATGAETTAVSHA
jgi:hypothetical protein